MKKEIKIDKAPAPIAPYSQCVEANGLLFVSGQIPINPETGKIEECIELQTKQVMENIKAILFQSGVNMSNIVKASIFIADLENFSKVNEIYASYFSKPYPARECIQAARLPKNVGVEISVIACISI